MGDNGAMNPIQDGPQLYHALAAAIEVGDKILFDHIMDFNTLTRPKTLGACLLKAIRRGDEYIGSRLIQTGADINISFDQFKGQNNTHYDLCKRPLVLALEARNKVIFNDLLTSRIEITTESHQGSLTLITGLWEAAVRWGDESVIYDLICLGAYVDGTDESTPLCTAVEIGDEGMIKLLLQAGAKVNRGRHKSGRRSDIESIETPIALAVTRGDESLVSLLLRAGANINTEALLAAIVKDDLGMIELLLSAGANVHMDSSLPDSPLSMSVRKGNIALMTKLMTAGADPGDSIAWREAMIQSQEVRSTLLQSFTKKYPRGKWNFGADLLINAVEQDDIQTVKLLADLKTNMNVWSRHGNALGLAIEADGDNQMEIIQILLENGCDANAIVMRPGNYSMVMDSEALLDLKKETALGVAIRTKRLGIVKFLIDMGADITPDCVQGGNGTPLQRAAEVGALDIVEYLLQLGANVNAPAAKYAGATALQAAATQGYAGIADYLIFKRADVNAAGARIKGCTALRGQQNMAVWIPYNFC
ncbi:ankyrin repeat-containing domain protein [Xylariales sp. PMI_506]|nr:ankyrin repeat-containing domain protein [Xylariales sp. PMI_506]